MIDYTKLIVLALGATTVAELRDVLVELLEALSQQEEYKYLDGGAS